MNKIQIKKESDIPLIKKSLKQMPVFRGLSEKHMDQIIDNFHILNVSKEGTVFYQSDESTDLYIVLKGKVRAVLLDEEGRELILTTFCEGEFFGEMSVLDGQPRSATIIAEEDSTLGILKRESVLLTIKNDSMIAIDLLSAIVQRLRQADEMIESLAFLDVTHRLIKLLLQIAQMEGRRDVDGSYRVKKITHKELAARTGASREAISKVLKILVFKKIIREDEGYFIISPGAEDKH